MKTARKPAAKKTSRTRSAAKAAPRRKAPAPPNPGVIALDNIREYFNRSTRTLREADSGFAPRPELYTVAATVAHVAQTVDWFMEGAFRKQGFNMDFESMDKEVRRVTSLESARAWFERSIAAARKKTAKLSPAALSAPLPPGPIMGGAPRIAIYQALVDHTAHHRGVLAVYQRLLGKVAPMPYMEM